MGKYVAYLKQKGEGCDYTIGCARTMLTINANNIDNAKEKMIEILKENYCGETELSSCIIYEISNELKIDVKSIYNDIENDKKIKRLKKQEELEKAEMDRLIKKYKNFK